MSLEVPFLETSNINYRARRIASLTGVILAVAAGFGVADKIDTHERSNNMHCDTADLVAYNGNTSEEATRKIPGVVEYDLDYRNIRMHLSDDPQSHAIPAGAIDYMNGTLYGPASCEPNS